MVGEKHRPGSSEGTFIIIQREAATLMALTDMILLTGEKDIDGVDRQARH